MHVEFEEFIATYHDAFDSDFCDTVVKYFDELEKYGVSYDRFSNEQVSSLKKDNDAITTASMLNESNTINLAGFGDSVLNYFNTVLAETIIPEYKKQYSILETFTGLGCYVPKIQKIKKGQGYHVWHCEVSNAGTAHRLLSYILYLNDVTEGGETEFLYQMKRVKPTKGTLILFPSYYTHTHRGNPPLSNTKYILNGHFEF